MGAMKVTRPMQTPRGVLSMKGIFATFEAIIFPRTCMHTSLPSFARGVSTYPIAIAAPRHGDTEPDVTTPIFF